MGRVMNTRILSTLGLSFSVLVGCAGESGGDQLCGRVQACAENRGVAFSETECKHELQTALEKAENVGCAEEYVDYMDCVGSLEFSCSDDLEAMITTECGGKAKKVGTCSGGTIGKDACQDASDRAKAKFAACGVPLADSSTDDEDYDPSTCTKKAAAAAKQAAACLEDVPCGALAGDGTPGLQEYAACASK